MACAPCRNEQMPYHVVVSHALHRIEDHSTCVREPARSEPEHTGTRNIFDQWLDRNYNQPAHPEVESGGKMRNPKTHRDFRDDADERKRPDYCQERPTPRTTERTQRERRVRAGDEEENRGVVENTKEALSLRQGQSVINCGCRVQENQRCAKNRRAFYG